jgi:hypothetical protein
MMLLRAAIVLLVTLLPGVVRAEGWLVDAMADKTQWALTGQRKHFSLGASKLEVAKSPARPGFPTVLKLTCDLQERPWMGIQWRGTPLAGRPERLSFWLHGDGCGHSLAARFEDAAGRIYHVPLEAISFEGWREIEVPTDPSGWTAVRRLGDLEAAVRWPVSLRELRVVKANSKLLTPTVAFSELRAVGRPGPFDRVQVRLSCEAPASVFYQGEPVRFQAQIENPGSASVSGRLEAVVCDWLGREERHPLGELRLDSGKTHKAAYDVSVRRLGSYTLWLRWVGETGVAEGRLRMAVSQRRSATPEDSHSPMGMGLYLSRFRDEAQFELALTLAREAGVKWTREGMSIANAQPEPGRWGWDVIAWLPSQRGHAVELLPHMQLEVPNSDALNQPCKTGELTLAFRLRLTSLDYSNRWPSLLRKGGSGGDRQWSLFWNTATGQLGLSLGDGKTRWNDFLSTKKDWQVGRWYTIVLSHRRADRSVQWWVDGQPSGTMKSVLSTTLVANDLPMTIGGGLSGALDDLAIYDRALEPSALAGAKPVSHWTFDEGQGLRIVDRSGANHIEAKPWRPDVLLAKAREQGISTYHILSGTPKWMSSRMTEGSLRAWACMPRLDDWSAAVEKVVARQKQAGARVWEIWNEPNLLSFWSPEPSPEEYTQFLIASYKAIKRADPQALVLGCSLAGPNGLRYTKPYEFVEEVLKRGGGQAMDAISIHPYRQPRTPEESGYLEDLQAISDLTAKYGRRLPIWITEVGWPTDPSGSSESRSAQLLVRSYSLAMAHGIENIAWYDYHDDGVDPTYNEHHFGILYNDLTPKPSYFAYRTMATELAGLRFQREVPAGDGVSVLVFGNGERREAVAWSHRGTRQLAFQVGDRRRLETVDLMGNPQEAPVVAGVWLATLDETPVFLRDVPASLAAIRPIDASPAILKVLPGESRSLEVTLRNPFSVPVHLTWAKETVELPAGGEKRITLTRTAETWVSGIEPWRSADGLSLLVPTQVVMLEGQREPILRYDAETSKSIELPDSSGANVTDEVTVAARFRSQGPTGTWESLATKWKGEHRNWGVFLGRENGDLSFSASFAKGPGSFMDIGSNHSLFDGQWHRVSVTYSAHDAEVCFYVDGKLVRRVPRDGGKLLTNQGPVSLAGGFADPRVTPPKPQAAVSHLRVWNRALSAEEVRELRN